MTGVEWSVAFCRSVAVCSLQEWREEEPVVAGLKPEGARGSLVVAGLKGQFIICLTETACGMWLEI